MKPSIAEFLTGALVITVPPLVIFGFYRFATNVPVRIEDPNERGMAYIALAIVAHAIFHSRD